MGLMDVLIVYIIYTYMLVKNVLITHTMLTLFRCSGFIILLVYILDNMDQCRGIKIHQKKKKLLIPKNI